MMNATPDIIVEASALPMPEEYVPSGIYRGVLLWIG
jgi:hypothetical protein